MSSREYQFWRERGVAFCLRDDAPYNQPNLSLASGRLCMQVTTIQGSGVKKKGAQKRGRGEGAYEEREHQWGGAQEERGVQENRGHRRIGAPVGSGIKGERAQKGMGHRRKEVSVEMVTEEKGAHKKRGGTGGKVTQEEREVQEEMGHRRRGGTGGEGVKERGCRWSGGIYRREITGGVKK